MCSILSIPYAQASKIMKNASANGFGVEAENGARLQVKASGAVDAFDERLKSIHRLDKPVAGLMLMAKTSSAHRSLTQWLKERQQISKVYRAIVEKGHFPRSFGVTTHDTWQFQVDLAVDGKAALTLGRTLEEWEGFCVLELSPVTGRRHQLRIHMASLGCPIVGDTEYGSRSRISGGILLAAVELRFPHPEEQSRILEFREEEPQHFKSWREKASCWLGSQWSAQLIQHKRLVRNIIQLEITWFGPRSLVHCAVVQWLRVSCFWLWHNSCRT